MSDKKVALVTGASRGIGAGIAERFARAGWDLTISARKPDTLEEKAEELRSHGNRVEAIAADMTDEDALVGLANAHASAHGRCDVLIVNAGMGSLGTVAEMPAKRFDRLYQVNVRAPYVLIQAALPTLRKTADAHGKAKVIALGSISGVHPEPELSAYGATKAALISLCATLNLEESENGVAATTLAPGYVNTDMAAWTGIPDEEKIEVNDIAAMVFAISELSRNAVVPNIVVTRPGRNISRA